MSATVQNNLSNPMVQEAYQLIGQLSENQLAVTVKSIKELIKQNNNYEMKQEELQIKEAAFAELLELRKKFAATNPKSLEEERFEAMAEKYPFLKDDVKCKE